MQCLLIYLTTYLIFYSFNDKFDQENYRLILRYSAPEILVVAISNKTLSIILKGCDNVKILSLNFSWKFHFPWTEFNILCYVVNRANSCFMLSSFTKPEEVCFQCYPFHCPHQNISIIKVVACRRGVCGE